MKGNNVQENGIGIWDTIAVWFSAALLWLGGESGRVIIASGMGGFVRWLGDEKRRIGTGVIAIIGGAVVGYYMWPLLLLAPQMFGADVVEKTPETIAMAGFLTGTMGVSLVKIVVAVVEARGKKLQGGGDE